MSRTETGWMAFSSCWGIAVMLRINGEPIILSIASVVVGLILAEVKETAARRRWE